MFGSIIPGGSLGKLARNLFLIGLFFHLLAAWFTVGYQHPDEYYQIIEFASYKLGKTPAVDLAWEFAAGIRPAFQPAMIYVMCKLANLNNPVVISFLLRLISVVTAWAVACLFVLVSLKECRTDRAKKIILYLSAFLWYIPYIHARFSSENWSAIFFFAGLSLLMIIMNPDRYNLKMKPGFLSFLLCGVLLGLSFVVRFQSGFMILGLGVWLLIYGKVDIKRLCILFTGIVFSIGIGVLTDRWFYGRWLLTAFNYFHVNIIEGRTAQWGTSPWWDYFVMIFVNNIPPFGIIILAGVFVYFFRFYKHLLTWVCVPFLLVHLINGHKDVRFLFPLVNALPVMIGFAFDENVYPAGINKLERLISSGFAMICAKVFVALNIVLMLIVCLKPANELFLFYDYMYENYGNTPTCLYTLMPDPYADLPVDFFRPAKLEVVNSSPDSVLYNEYFIKGVTHLVLEEGLVPSNSWRPANKKIRMVYQNIPEWVTKINFNNWLKHTMVLRVYAVE